MELDRNGTVQASTPNNTGMEGLWSFYNSGISISFGDPSTMVGMLESYSFQGTVEHSGDYITGTMSRSERFQRCATTSIGRTVCTSQSSRPADDYSGCWMGVKD